MLTVVSGVVGNSGTGKSHLINTVLEATTCEEDYKRNAQSDVIVTENKHVEFGEEQEMDDGMDLQVCFVVARL